MMWKWTVMRVTLVLGMAAVSSCVGRLDAENCTLIPGTYVPSFFLLSGDCGNFTESDRLIMDIGLTSQMKLGQQVALTEVRQQGCQISIKHEKTVGPKDTYEGNFIPVGGGEFLEGAIVRTAALAAKECRSRYFVVLTQEDRMNSIIANVMPAGASAGAASP